MRALRLPAKTNHLLMGPGSWRLRLRLRLRVDTRHKNQRSVRGWEVSGHTVQPYGLRVVLKGTVGRECSHRHGSAAGHAATHTFRQGLC